MTHTKQFIEDAVAGGGIDFNGYFTDCDKEDVLDSIHRVLLDPAAWQAVGKTRGWGEIVFKMEDKIGDHPFMGGTLNYPYYEGAAMVFTSASWKYNLHRFIDHLADGKTVEEALAAISE